MPVNVWINVAMLHNADDKTACIPACVALWSVITNQVLLFDDDKLIMRHNVTCHCSGRSDSDVWVSV